MRQEVVKRCKVDKDTSRCEKCRKLVDKVQIDHIVTVVPLLGFDDWNGFISRMFTNPENLQGICKECHDKISTRQNETRKEYRKLKK